MVGTIVSSKVNIVGETKKRSRLHFHGLLTFCVLIGSIEFPVFTWHRLFCFVLCYRVGKMEQQIFGCAYAEDKDVLLYLKLVYKLHFQL